MYDNDLFKNSDIYGNGNKGSSDDNTSVSSSVTSDTYGSASNESSYEDIYSSKAKAEGTGTNDSSAVNDGSYHHSYVDSNTYNPNRNTYDSNYSTYGDSYNNTSYSQPNAQQNQYQSNNYQQRYYTNPYSNSYNTGKNYSQKPVKPKKEKSRVGAGTIAIILVVCIILSGACGFGGTMLYNVINKTESTTDDGQLVVHKINADVQNGTENLQDKSTAEITDEVADAVVEITTEVMTTNSFYGQMVQTGAGSGVIISDDGYIVTNNHVIEGASSIRVTLRDGTGYDATLIGTDSQEDVALIKIEATGLTEVIFGDSDTIKVGDKAVAIGNPLGTLGGTVTDGIISALDRKINIDGETMTLLQTDTAINPGNSGGGLFNGQGELIGIVSAKSTGDEVDNLGFAIPINNVLNILSDLKEHGYVTGRPSIGADLIDISNEMYSMYYFGSRNTGVFVNNITSTTAQESGLKAGDRIVSVNGTEVKSSSEVDEIIEELSVGDEVSLVVERNGQTGTIKIKLEESKPDASNQKSNSNSNSDDFFNPFG